MKKLCLGLALVLLASITQADLIANWKLQGLSNSNDNPPSSGVATWDAENSHANIDSGILSRGAGANPVSTLKDTFAWRNADESSLADAITGDRYAAFTITAESGYHFSVTEVEFWLSIVDLSQGRELALFSDATGLTASDALWTLTPDNNKAQYTIDLSSESIEDVTSVEFRLYAWGADNEWRAQGFGFDNDWGDPNREIGLSVSGSVELIPEPGTIALLSMGFIGLVAARRRMRA